MKRKVLLDTDIGSDIDDAFCLAYLLASEQCEVVGVTTVSGCAAERARLATLVCAATGKPGVPVYAGIEAPFSGTQKQPDAPQTAVLDRTRVATPARSGDAISFMADVIGASPGEVTLLSIGPMTNVAALFLRHPDAAGRIRDLMLMAGRFGTGPSAEPRREEWNVYCDPEAARIVYRTPIRVHRSVGLDVTMQVRMPVSEVRTRMAQVPSLSPVLQMLEVWGSNQQVMTFHDPLAGVCLFDASICGFERGNVRVDPSDKLTPGMTRWTADPGGPHEVAMSVVPERFFSRYFAAFGIR